MADGNGQEQRAAKYSTPEVVAADLVNRFSYHAPKPGQAERYQEIRRAALAFAQVLVDQCPPGKRETALAMTNLEQACFWANASIARNE